MKTKTFTFYVKEMPLSKSPIASSDEVFEQVKSLVQMDQESFWVLGLNSRNRIIYQDCIFIGGIDQCPVDFRILFKRLLTVGAHKFILVHNHPGGNCEPSKQDKQLTQKLKEASTILQLELLDHIIISDDGYYSFRDMFLLR